MSSHCIPLADRNTSIDDGMAGTMWKTNYIFHKEIGRGHFAKVWEVECRDTGAQLASKVIRRRRGGDDKIELIRREIGILRVMQARASNVIRLLDVHETKSEVALITELASGGCLYQVCEDLSMDIPEAYVKRVMKQLLSALEHLHDQKIVHLDIKADNILLRTAYPGCDIALCDFGLAVHLDERKVHREMVGTPDYVAPEIINFEQISVSTDMWSVGVLAYFLLTGISPFMGPTKEETFINVSRMDISYDDEVFATVSPQALHFIQSLIARKQADRLTATDASKHPWLAIEGNISVSSDGSEDSGCDIEACTRDSTEEEDQMVCALDGLSWGTE